MTQEKIAEFLEREYGIEIERKAIGRNVSLLKEAGYEIETNREGSWLTTREFEDSELHLLIDGVLGSQHISAKHSKDLIEKLCGLSNKYFRAHVRNIYSVNEWNKTDNQSLFYNIEQIDEAIEKGYKIEFDYNKYGTDKKLHRTKTHNASPYQLILHNQRYYLMALNEQWGNMAYYRVDHITNMKVLEERLTPLNEVEGYEKGIDYSMFSSALPYMYTDKIERITFYADETIVDQIVDWFGKNAKIEKCENKLKVTVKASPMAMEYWAMQYLNYVEVVSPSELRDKIKENLENAIKKYN
jgi:predicted DNA-binding transcriptional regulator YafY